MKKRYFSLCLVMVMALVLGLLSLNVQAEELWGKFSSSDDIIGYKSFSNYNQAPELEKLVNSGKLPPVNERLPEKPMVWKENVMVDGIGEYGGIWRDTYAADTEGWHWGAGQSGGWFGVNQIQHEGLIKSGPMWMIEDPDTPTPNLAHSWKWSEDGKTLTIHLVEGVKWSDGVEFTTEDIIFSYRDNILDEKVMSWSSKGSWTYGDEVTRLEKVDDYTFKMHFGKAFPVGVLYRMGFVNFPLSPAHVYKYYHPKYNSEMSYDEYTRITPPQALPAVVLGSHVPVQYTSGQQLIFVRNPYYWKVDEKGNQLPYFDEIWYMSAQEARKGALNLIAGSTDRAQYSVHLVPMMLNAEQTKGHFKTIWPKVDIFARPGISFNLSLHAGVDNESDKALRKLFRKKEFRVAVSHAIDREGIAEAIVPGDYIKPWYGGFQKGSPMYDESKVVKYKYNPDRAKELLTQLGFEDTDGDGFVNWSDDSPMKGRNLVIECLVPSAQSMRVEVSEMLVFQFKQVGIDLRVKLLKGAALGPKMDTGDFDSYLYKSQRRLTPFLYPEEIGPITPYNPHWHISGPEGKRDLLPFEEEIRELLEATATMRSADERREAFGKILNLMTENCYTVGITQGKYPISVNNRMRNVPDDVPNQMYSYFFDGTPINAFGWASKDEQLQAKYQDLIPTPDIYSEQEWYSNENK